jgi:hypothetical protein
MIARKFYDLGFAVESRIGNAVELHSLEIPGVDEAIRQANLSGKPYTGFSTLTLSEGMPLGALPKDVKLIIDRCSTDRLDFDVVVNGNGWIIVSNRLGGALKEAAPNDIELLPVTITSMKGETLRSDFCVINILRMLEAISEKKTVRSRDKKSVFKLAVTGNKVPKDMHVFRVKEWPWAFLIDDVSKRALSKHPHDGLAFIPVEQE